ncbi:hypothetical protein QYE76_044966 [Lolium multiflorum]|uniref:Uncharacterized protein n=1 Tax=Lolium multiflorum TaxID=4521 RepID=A0AAD8TLM8_LOLMU|nr:hypothetical protein QYE76_044966 [Lolium multiflorum]
MRSEPWARLPAVRRSLQEAAASYAHCQAAALAARSTGRSRSRRWTSLRYLDLRSNSFVGDLGAYDFSGLFNLTLFDVAANNFSGTPMPLSIYFCTSMTALCVGNNEITGQVAPEIGNMRELQFISLTINYFTNISGMLTSGVARTSPLTTLLVSYTIDACIKAAVSQ